MKGKPKSAAHRAALAKAKIGNKNAFGHRLSAEAKAIISKKKRGHPMHADPEYRKKQRDNMLRIWAERKINAKR
ncbi:MAG: hypothetical protein U1E62_05360 [Alsobacter sp.]